MYIRHAKASYHKNKVTIIIHLQFIKRLVASLFPILRIGKIKMMASQAFRIWFRLMWAGPASVNPYIQGWLNVVAPLEVAPIVRTTKP